MISFFWSKTYEYKCPDGTTRIIHRDINTAFPLHVESKNKKTDSNINIPATLSSGFSQSTQTRIEGLLFELNDLSGYLMLKFRSAYTVYQANPCSGHDDFKHNIDRINKEHYNMMILRTKVKMLIDSAENIKMDHNVLCSGIIKLLDDFKIVETSSVEIESNRNIMKEIQERENA